jgi:hypothetical protein
MRRNFVQTRFSPRPTGIPHVRKFTTQAGINYLTNNQNRLDTREIIGLFQTEMVNTDVVGIMYTDTFDRLVRPFDVAPGVRIPVGEYDFHTVQLSYTGGQQRKISGAIAYDTGTYYGGTQQSISVSSARMEITPRVSLEPAVSVNFLDLPQASFTATVFRTRATYTITPRMFVSGIVQYNSTTATTGSNLRQMGIRSRERVIRCLYRRLRRVRSSAHCPSKPRFRRQDESAVSTLTGTRWRSHSRDDVVPPFAAIATLLTHTAGPSVGLSCTGRPSPLRSVLAFAASIRLMTSKYARAAASRILVLMPAPR